MYPGTRMPAWGHIPPHPSTSEMINCTHSTKIENKMTHTIVFLVGAALGNGAPAVRSIQHHLKLLQFLIGVHIVSSSLGFLLPPLAVLKERAKVHALQKLRNHGLATSAGDAVAIAAACFLGRCPTAAAVVGSCGCCGGSVGGARVAFKSLVGGAAHPVVCCSRRRFTRQSRPLALQLIVRVLLSPQHRKPRLKSGNFGVTRSLSCGQGRRERRFGSGWRPRRPRLTVWLPVRW